MKFKMMSAALAIRMIASVVTCLVVTTVALAEDQAADAAGPKAITVDASAQARFGVSIATLKGVAAPTGTETTARVLDPGPLLKLDSELAASAAAFAASRAEALRTRKLFS